MTPHEQILKLIESVSPDDTAKLDEIDARAYCFVHNETYKGFRRNNYGNLVTLSVESNVISNSPQYTRSRDALKAIRPEGWCFMVECQSRMYDNWWCVAENMRDARAKETIAKNIRTEELAELHAIISAIAHERSQS